MKEFKNYKKIRIENLMLKNSKNVFNALKKTSHQNKSLRCKKFNDFKETFLQEKLLGNAGRWEEAINNKKNIYSENIKFAKNYHFKKMENIDKIIKVKNKENNFFLENLLFKFQNEKNQILKKQKNKNFTFVKKFNIIEKSIKKTQKKASNQAKKFHLNQINNLKIKKPSKIQDLYINLFSKTNNIKTINNFYEKNNINIIKSYISENNSAKNKRKILAKRKSLDFHITKDNKKTLKSNLSESKFPSVDKITNNVRKKIVNSKKIIKFSVSHEYKKRNTIEYLHYLKNQDVVCNFYLTKIQSQNLPKNNIDSNSQRFNDLQKVYEIINQHKLNFNELPVSVR